MPNHFATVSVTFMSASRKIGYEFERGDAWQEAISRRSRRHECRQARELYRRRAADLRDDKDAFIRILHPDDGVPRLWIEPNGTGERTIIHPLAQHELILILDI